MPIVDGAHRPADDEAREEVEHRRQVQLVAAPDHELRRVRHPARQLTSDGLYAYEGAVGDAFTDGVDFGMLVKPNTTDVEDHSIPRPGQRPVLGSPDPDHINTSYGERSNLSLRMGNRRYTRQTNAFSKKLVNHCHMLTLWFTFYNFCRPHKGMGGKTPAQAAGFSDSVYPVSWIVELIDIRARKPNRPNTYRKRRALEGGEGR